MRVVSALLILLGFHFALAGPPDGGPKVKPTEGEQPAGSASRGSEGGNDGAQAAGDHVLRPLVVKAQPPLPALDPGGGVGQSVVIIPIHGTIDQGLAPYVKRALALAESRGARAVIIDVDTFGGRVDAAVIIRDALLGASVPVVAYVNRRAISAGALISYAADFIAFAPGGSMGAATPVQAQGGQMAPVDEKVTSYMRSEMRATAEANGRNGDLAEAMVDRTIQVEGANDRGKLLTVTTEQAVRLGIANAEVGSLDALLKTLGLEKASRIEPEITWAEQVARFLTDPVVAGLLMSIGMLGLLIEFYSPGFGFAGALGLLCLLLFFSGHLIVDLAGFEELILFVVGLVLLGVELFVLPGFGVVGALGIAAVVGSLVLALLGLPVSVSWQLGSVGTALGQVMLSLAGSVVVVLVLARFLPRTPVGRFLVLNTTLREAHAVAEGPAEAPDEAPYLGRTGVAITDLRPSGKADLGGELVDVVSRHGYVDRGTRVRVVEVEGARVVVVPEADGES